MATIETVPSFESRAAVAMENGDFVLAATLYESELLCSVGSKRSKRELTYKLGIALSRGIDTKRALECFLDTLAAAKAAGDTPLAAQALWQTARLSWPNAQCEFGLSVTKRYKDFQAEPAYLDICLERAHLLTSVGRNQDALSLLDSVEGFGGSITFDTVIRLLHERAYATARLGLEKEALARYEQVVSFARRRSNLELYLTVLNNYAVFARCTSIDLARTLHAEVIDRSKRGNIKWRLQYYLASHSLTSYFGGQLTEARQLLDRSMEDRAANSQVALAHAACALLLASATDDQKLATRIPKQELLSVAVQSNETYRIAPLSAGLHAYHMSVGDEKAAQKVLLRAYSACVHPEGSSLLHLAIALHGSKEMVAGALTQLRRLSPESRVRHASEAMLSSRLLAPNQPQADALKCADRSAIVFGELGWPLHRAAALELAERYGQASALYDRCGANGFRRRLRKTKWKVGRPRRVPGQLTNKQLEVARLCAAGIPNKEISTRLGIAPATVDFHVRNILRELQISSRRGIGPSLGL